MSTCVHQNYGVHNHSPDFSPGIRVNVGTSEKPFNIMYISKPPPNPNTGEIYFDTTTQKMRLYNGNNWIDVQDSIVNQEYIDDFDIIAPDIGFVKVKLFQEVDTGKRGVMILNDEDVFIDSTEEALNFIKEKLPDSYLWVEKRIMDHLA